MKKIENFEQVKASGEFDQLKPGGYIGVLYKAEDESEKEYLKVSFDIAEGEFGKFDVVILDKVEDILRGTLHRDLL